IQQYLQNEHYALWEVIEFGDSYEAPKDGAATGTASDGKKGRTIAVTTEEMQKRKNDKDEENLLKQQYGNFKAEGKDTLDQTFIRLQAIVSQLEFIDVEIKQDDLNQKLLTSLAPEWLIHTIVWRNRSDLDTMSLDDLYNYLKVYEPEVQKKSYSQNMAFISSSKNNSRNGEDNTACVPTASAQVSPAGSNVATASISLDTACAYIASQSNGECRAPRSQYRGRRDNYRQGSKVEEQAPKALMAIDGVGFDWSYMANEEENHALVADEEAPIEFALMAKSSIDNEVFDNSLCSKACRKNTDSLNSQITKLSKKLGDTKNMLYHYKLGLSQVEARLVEFKNQEIKFCEKIRGLEFSVECKANRIENLTNELETLKKEKEGLDSKLTGFKSAFKDLDNLLESQRSDKNKEGLGYSDVPPPPAQVYSPPKKDINSFAFENEESTGSILSKPKIKFLKPADSPTVAKTDKKETVRKPTVKYAELYRKTSKRSNGNSQNNIDDKGYWDNGCSRHMTGNISYLTDYEPYNGGYVSFGQGGCKITGKGTIKTSKLEFENVYFMEDLKYNLFNVS
nr:ribonuclease H-like domain-containing protein [Tanacetum cinerariifolium]